MASREVAVRDLRERRTSLVSYSGGLALYIVVVLAVYPAFKDSTSLDKLTTDNPSLAALFGISGSITSGTGWLSANIYANFLPLVVLLLAIGYGASCLAGQEENGHLELVLTLPLTRRTVVLNKIAALALQVAVVSVVTFLSCMTGRWFELRPNLGHLATATVGVGLLGIDLGLVAMAIGAVTGDRSLAIGVAAAVAVLSYLISSLAPVIPAIAHMRFVSLFYWAIGANQLDHGLGLGASTVLLGTGVAAALTVIVLFDRHDLRTS